MLFNKNKAYCDSLNKSGIFDNKSDDMFAQTVCADLIRKHFANASKTPKALIMGFDGARADSMNYLVKSKKDKFCGKLFYSQYSAVNMLKTEGGLYLSYAGGEINDPQETSTAQGWTAILNGKWGNENGVKKHVTLSEKTPTVLRELANKDKKSVFLAQWPDHFTITYKKEISISEEEKIPLDFIKYETDEELAKGFSEKINGDTDCIFGIFEAPDYNGHTYGFGSNEYRYVTSVCNLDRIAYNLIEQVKNRPEYPQEDWLIMITSDHGGHGRGHGSQKNTDRITFIACNKQIEKI